jgi:hypothetical protein
MKAYRIKHIPTGLYYKPSTSTNLTKRGKAYTTANNILTYSNSEYIHISLRAESESYKKNKEYFDQLELYPNAYYKSSWRKLFRIPINDFTKEEL